jgi:hypothetical protein
MKKEKGFIAHYRRRLPTAWEKIEELTIAGFGQAVVAEIKHSMCLYDYFKGIEHRQVLPRRWGAGDTV